MSDRNQFSYNPNQYPNQVPYGQPGAQPSNDQQGYQQSQQPPYLPVGFPNASYTYPMAQFQPDVYMVPTYPVAQASPQGYMMADNDMGHFMPGPGTAPWANHSQNAVNYGAMDPARALTPQPVGNPSWGAYPVASSSTPQAQMHGPGHMAYQHHQRISLTPGDGMVDSRSFRHLNQVQSRSSLTPPFQDQPNSAGKFTCPHCTSPHARKADLQRHIRSVHTQESPYRCLGCGTGFVRSDARGTHWKNEPACKAEHSKRDKGRS